MSAKFDARVTQVSNLNTVNTSGFYWVYSNTTGAPGSCSYGILHMQVTDTEAMQVGFPYSIWGDKIKIRRTVNGQWSDWTIM